MKFVNSVDLQKNALLNAVLQPLNADPSTPVVGQFYYNTVTKRGLFWDGTVFKNEATDSAALNGQAAAYYLSRANHTGSQTASTISDLATTVQGYRLDQFVAPTANLSIGNNKLINVADPTSNQDAATKSYVDSVVQNAAAGIDSKPSCRVVTTTNDSLSGLSARDGVSIIAGDRILVVGQTTASANGVYVAAAGAWARALDADQTGEITPGSFWYVEEGTTNASTQWRCANTGGITLGSTAISIIQFGAAAVYTASLGVVKVGNDFRGVVVASGGLTVGASGFAVDTAIVARKFSASVGTGAATSIVVTHNLGTKDVIVQCRLNATDEAVIVDWVATDTNSITVTFATAPASNAYRITVLG